MVTLHSIPHMTTLFRPSMAAELSAVLFFTKLMINPHSAFSTNHMVQIRGTLLPWSTLWLGRAGSGALSGP